MLLSEQVAAEHGGEGEGHDGRSAERRDEGYAQRCKQATLHAGEEEEGNEADDDDQCGVQNRHAHFARGLEHHLHGALPQVGGEGTVFAQTLVDILHIDDGIVHKRADGDGHTAQTHGVDGKPHGVEGEERDDQRQGDGDQRDESGAHVQEEDEEYDDHKDAAFEERLADIVDGAAYEAFLTVDVGGHLHVVRERFCHVRQCGVEAFGQFERADVRLFRHGHHHAGFAFERCGAHLRCAVADFHFGNVGERHRHLSDAFDDGLPQVFGIVCGEHAPYDVFVAVFVKDAAGGVAVHLLHGTHHLAQPDAVVFQPCRVHECLVFLDVASEHRHLCHASRGEQPGAYGPVGQCAQVAHGGGVFGGKCHEHEFAQDGRLRTQCRGFHPRRKLAAEGGNLFRNRLTGTENVGAPVEFHPYDGEAGGRRRTYAPHVGGTVHGGFYGEGHQLFHLFGSHTLGFGHDGHGRGVEVGKDVHVHRAGGTQSGEHEQHCSHQHQQAVVERKLDDTVQHVLNGYGYVRVWQPSWKPSSP